jgi:hypothetical protein
LNVFNFSLDFSILSPYLVFEHVQNADRRLCMHQLPNQLDYLEIYYCVYLGEAAVLIVALNWVLRGMGRVFLSDAFAGNSTLVRAVARLMDIGFYLVSLGYTLITYQTMWPINDLGTVIRIASIKIGGLLLLLGIAHIFNLLLFALFRQRRAPEPTHAAGA